MRQMNGAWVRPGPETASSLTRFAWAAALGSLALLSAALFLVVRGWSAELPEGFTSWRGQLAWVLGAAGAPVLGGVIAAKRPGNSYGWVWLGYAASLAASILSRAYVSFAAAEPSELPATGAVAVIADITWALWLGHIPFLLLLFPTGRLPGARWRWAARAAAAGTAVIVSAGSLAPDLGTVPLENPLGAPGTLGEVLLGLSDLGVYVVLAAIVAGSLSLVPRYRRAQQTERRQITWFTYAAAVVALGVAVDPFFEPPGAWDALYETVTFGILYLAVGIAILRHGLYDIDRIVNRTLVYLTLSLCLVGTYVLVVGYLGTVFGGRQTAVVSLLTTGLIAVAFAPLRDRLQQLVNQLMYGDRVDPYTVVSDLARRLETAAAPDDVLGTIVETVARSLSLRSVELWYADGAGLRIGAVHGQPRQDVQVADVPALVAAAPSLLVVPLSHRGETVGALRLELSGGVDELSEGDAELVRDLAAHAGPATHAVGLTAQLRASLAELRSSRERLFSSQQEERLRIHRDLHDGLGPVLASMRLRLEACLEVAPETVPALVTELERLHELVGGAAGDVRTLVHDLHPPALAQLGLVEALRQHCDGFARDAGLDVDFAAVVDDELMPPAVQVALYRIVQESLVNVDRHADAQHVEIRLGCTEGELILSVRDDGAGGSDGPRVAGAGIESMRTRAELLGGRLQFCSDRGAGTLVSVRVPTEGWSDGG